jgi:hypothetical protein
MNLDEASASETDESRWSWRKASSARTHRTREPDTTAPPPCMAQGKPRLPHSLQKMNLNQPGRQIITLYAPAVLLHGFLAAKALFILKPKPPPP